uniref:c-Myc-binding protein n=1 Tax=Trichogramma kaykai TaxID=54128 RepID=A0ABD2WTM5_9HYME
MSLSRGVGFHVRSQKLESDLWAVEMYNCCRLKCRTQVHLRNIVCPVDVKREEFRKYLEHAGVMDALTNVLVSLYESSERPEDALEYLRRHFMGSDSVKVEKQEVESLKKELCDAKAQIAELKLKLSKHDAQYSPQSSPN